jgi:hypothetical protein
MLRIRQEQMHAFARNAREMFVRRSVDHIRSLLPDEYARLGEERVRDSVEHAIARCRQYGITEGYDVLRYVNLMYTLGHHFDDDGQYAWAADLLKDRQISPRIRLDLLVEQAKMTLADSEALS